MPFLGKGIILGTDELDPAGFHDQAQRALEGAILVRTRYTPADTLAWDDLSAAAWSAGWVIGDAVAHGADSPKSLDRALEARATEADAGCRRDVSLTAVTVGAPPPFDLIIVADNSVENSPLS